MSKSRNVMAATAQNVTTTLRRPKLRGVVALAALAVGLVGPALPAHAAAAPDAPTAVVATPSGTSLSVAFTPGSTNGASGVSYAVDCTGTGPAGSASGSGSPIVVSGLGKGQTYTCTVTAQSDEGPSAASDPSDPEQLATTAPGAPSIDGITLGSSSVTVDFSAPADNGGDAITGYAVTCDSAGDHPAPVSGAGMSLTVGSLVTGDSYTCTVHATNGVGDGSESAPSESFVAATAPGAPSVTSVTQINPNSLRVAFTPGSDNNDPITGYRVTCTSSNGGITRTKSGGDSPITVTNLSNAKTYTCKVVASNSIGNSPASNASDAKPAAVLPGQPSITSATRGSNSVSVAFTPGSTGGDVIIDNTVTCSSVDGDKTASGASSPIVVGSLVNGDSYDCVVVSTNHLGDGPPSTATTVTAATTPEAPDIDGVVQGDNSVTVSFHANGTGGDAIASYTVRCTSSDGGATQTVTDTATSIEVDSLTNGKTYSCTVKATNGIGAGASASTSSFVAAIHPSAPAITAVALGDHTLVVTFTPGAKGGSLDGEMEYTATCTAQEVGGATGRVSASSSPITVTGLTLGDHYQCVVVATNPVGDSPASAAKPNTPVAIVEAPGAPAITSVDLSDDEVSVSFDPPASDGGNAITSYTVTCTSSHGDKTASRASSPITVTSLVGGDTYSCVVTATNSVGTSAGSDASDTFIVLSAPGAPAGVTVTRGPDSAVVAFTPNASDGGDEVLYFRATCRSSNGGISRAKIGLGSPITVPSLSHGRNYRCTVTATNSVGTSAASAPSNQITVQTVPGQPAITGVTRLTNNAARVAFSSPDSNGGEPITGYTATCSSGGGATKSASGAVSPLTVSSLTNGASYTCTVLATNAVGDGSASSSSAPFTAATTPGKPAITGVTRLPGNAASVAFAAVNNGGSAITGDTVSCTSSTAGAVIPSPVAGVSSPITVSGLTNGAAYTCIVVATNAFGDSDPSDASSSFVAATVPGAPTAARVTHTRGTTSASVIFTAPAGNGGSAIIRYNVSCAYPGLVTPRTAIGAGTTIVVTGLVVGKVYTCTVTATNAVGTGAASAAVVFTA